MVSRDVTLMASNVNCDRLWRKPLQSTIPRRPFDPRCVIDQTTCALLRSRHMRWRKRVAVVSARHCRNLGSLPRFRLRAGQARYGLALPLSRTAQSCIRTSSKMPSFKFLILATTPTATALLQTMAQASCRSIFLCYLRHDNRSQRPHRRRGSTLQPFGAAPWPWMAGSPMPYSS